MSKTKHITINRATAFGIAQCTGELFEAHGLQFCITNSVDPQIYGLLNYLRVHWHAKGTRLTIYVKNHT